MKLPYRIAAIAILVLAVMFLAASPPGSAAAERDNAAQASEQVESIAPITVGVQVVSDRQIIEVWTRESVGKMLLNSKRVQFVPVKELEGHPANIAKPKIYSPHDAITLRYNGLGSDHFARADV